MSTHATAMPDELASPQAKLVYLYLSTTNSATVDELGAGLDLPKISLYTIVRTLRERNLVEKDGNRLRVAR